MASIISADPIYEYDFKKRVFNSKKPVVLNKEFLKKYINNCCIENNEGFFTPLQWAAGKGYLEVVEYLVENGANIALDDSEALLIAAEHKQNEIVEYLVKKDADVFVNNNEVFRIATESGNYELTEHLLNTNTFSDEYIHSVAENITFPDMHELLINYRQFSNTKAIK